MVHNSPETTTGGKALKFYASDPTRYPAHRNPEGWHGFAVGNRTRVKVVKNKWQSAFQICGIRHSVRRGNQPGRQPDRPRRGAGDRAQVRRLVHLRGRPARPGQGEREELPARQPGPRQRDREEDQGEARRRSRASTRPRPVPGPGPGARRWHGRRSEPRRPGSRWSRAVATRRRASAGTAGRSGGPGAAQRHHHRRSIRLAAWGVPADCPGTVGDPGGRGGCSDAGEADPEAVARQICLRMLTAAPRTRAQLAARCGAAGCPRRPPRRCSAGSPR